MNSPEHNDRESRCTWNEKELSDPHSSPAQNQKFKACKPQNNLDSKDVQDTTSIVQPKKNISVTNYEHYINYDYIWAPLKDQKDILYFRDIYFQGYSSMLFIPFFLNSLL